MSLEEEEAKQHQRYMSTENRPCEDAAREWPSASKWRDLRRNQVCSQLDLGFPSLRTVKKQFLLFKPPSFIFCYGSLSKLIHQKTRKFSSGSLLSSFEPRFQKSHSSVFIQWVTAALYNRNNYRNYKPQIWTSGNL